ncbi:GyrI-like domain-containing protein [Mesobacillus subterraneus]|uniref:AraC family transcriptional regulator n=1 Tax=Mesobacillus subterraneus TaxID=285983 RepID=A0A427TX94_9BACI|nr:GyrI-like domain-containing protein [Mesobacillus subterraneus]RSD28775.1 AraC family transcriptional regulator [Mesobacillus subterraneus]
MCQVLTKEFKIVGAKKYGAFVEYAQLVPEAARQFLQRADEIENSTGIEVTVYEPKRDETHKEGTFYVGILVNERVASPPEGMEFLEFQYSYATIKGKESDMGKLYSQLDGWIEAQKYTRNNNFIIEVYHPEELVEIYIPIENA